MTSLELVSALWGVAAAVLVAAGLRRWLHRQARTRMQRLGVGFRSTEGALPPFRPRTLVGLLGARAEGSWPAGGQQIQQLVNAAGVVGLPSVQELLGWKLLGLVLGILVGILAMLWLGGVAIVFMGAFALVGWLSVDFWLRRRAAARRRMIEHSLLTIMDLLSLSLEAGMGLDRALRVICERVESPFTQELRRVLAEVDLGVGRRAAFEHLAERVPLEDVRSLTTAIIQSEELSASLVDAMQVQTRSLRIHRRQQAETDAHRAPVKMMFPMVLFVLPALFIVILAPVGIQMARALGGG
jgi:tight adherence protein C